MQSIFKMAREALQIQDACNLSGLAASFPCTMDGLWDYARLIGKANTSFVNKHPVAVLWTSHMAYISSGTIAGESYGKAYAVCSELAKRDVEPRFKVGYDLEGEYEFEGKVYRVRYGAHRRNTREDYFPTVVKLVGTVTLKMDSQCFPDPDIVTHFADLMGTPLVGARHNEDFTEVEYDGPAPEIFEEEHTVWHTPYIERMRANEGFPLSPRSEARA